MSNRNKLVIPEPRQAINNLKMEISQDLGIPTLNGMTSNLYPVVINGISVRKMVGTGEKILVKTNDSPSDKDIY